MRGAPRVRAALACALLLGAAGCRPSPESMLEQAQNARFERKSEAALAAYRRAVDALERSRGAEAQVLRARALLGAAEVYDLELGDARRAVEVYRELLRVSPEAPEALPARLRLATLLKDRFGDTRGAIQALNDALARSPPESAELRYRVATLYFSLGDYAQVEQEAAEVARRYETSAWVDDALFLRAQALQLRGQRQAAAAAFSEVAARFPDGELRALALFEQGKLAEQGGDTPQAVALWLEALKVHPQPELVQAALGRVRERKRAEEPPPLGREEAFRGPARKER